MSALKVRVWIIATAVLFLLFLTVFIARLDALNLESVKILGASEYRADIAGVAQETLDQNYIFILPKSNIVLLPRDTLTRTLLTQFPHLLSVDLDIYTRDRILNISVIERQRQALWCRERDEAEECFFIDSSGVVFSDAPIFSGSVLFTYRGGVLVAAASALGQNIMPSEQYAAVNSFLKRLATLGIEPHELVIDEAEYEVITGRNLKILLKPDYLDRSIDNIKAAIAAGTLQTDPEFLDTLEYLDLRFENRIYYKYRD
jgi:hypothetical protein